MTSPGMGKDCPRSEPTRESETDRHIPTREAEGQATRLVRAQGMEPLRTQVHQAGEAKRVDIAQVRNGAGVAGERPNDSRFCCRTYLYTSEASPR